MSEHIIVTGGAGFLGSHLVDRLLTEGYSVTVIDDLITGSIDNLTQHANNPKFDFIGYDVSNPITIYNEVDYVFHFASAASPIDYMKYPVQTLKAGSYGTYETLELAYRKDAKYLLASTSEVYGDPKVHPQQEDYWGNVNPIGPRGVYDEAKRFGEAMVMAYSRYYDTDTRIARIFNTFGPRMRPDDGRVVPTFINQALDGEPLTIYGDGLQTRSFCYVSDLIEGIYRLSLCDYHEPVNIGNPIEMTILDFANIILGITNSKSEIVFRPLPVDDPTMRQPDISLARKLLNWEPKIPIDKGLQETVQYFINRKERKL